MAYEQQGNGIFLEYGDLWQSAIDDLADNPKYDIEMGPLSSTNRRVVIVPPGRVTQSITMRENIDLAEDVKGTVFNDASITNTVGSSYSVGGINADTLTVYADNSNTLTDIWNGLYDDDYGLGTPASNNIVIMKIANGTYDTQTFTFYPEDTTGQYIVIVSDDYITGVTYNATAGSKP